MTASELPCYKPGCDAHVPPSRMASHVANHDDEDPDTEPRPGELERGETPLTAFSSDR